MSKKEIIKLNEISKTYTMKDKEVNVLKKVSVSFECGKLYAIMGHSGSGKSTLINLIGLVDDFDSGTYILDNMDVKDLKEEEAAQIRLKKIGFIFQDFHLNKTMKAYENVMVPMIINPDINAKERKEKSIKLLSSFGLENRVDHFPKELSGGECQRVAIARALANDPLIILADEPTGDLDEKTEKEIFKLLRTMADDGKCVIVVSHSPEIKKYADTIYNLSEGKLKPVIKKNTEK